MDIKIFWEKVKQNKREFFFSYFRIICNNSLTDAGGAGAGKTDLRRF
jgi:hypothetical protein